MGKRILVVDYDPRSLAHTRGVLEEAGFAVSTCADGLTAIDHFKSLSPDLVLLSAMLPKMHGFEVCSNIRKLPGGDRTPVVLITDVYKGKRYRVDAINKYGATEYIEKPIEDTGLVSILSGLIRGDAPTAEEDLDERTVQFSAEMLSRAAEELPASGSKIPSEKKSVNEKPKSKDDLSKKLEDSLAGLELEVSKKTKAKEKTLESQAVAGEGAEALRKSPVDPGATFTSEDLFTDIIASVERELQSEKMIPSPQEEPAKTVTEQLKAPVPPPQAKPAPAKKPVFDAELEKKLSSTLSGLVKEKKEGAAAKAAKPAAVKIPEVPKVTEPVKPQPVAAQAASAVAPTVRMEAPPRPEEAVPARPVAKAKEAIPAVPVAVKEISHEGINFGQYLLLSKIATGGMAELFKANRKGVEGFEKILAIKRILPHMSDNEEFVTMFIDEAKLAAQLTHHNICQIFDLGKIENSYYIAMEYVHGKDLRAVLRAIKAKNVTSPVDLAVLITSKIASALDYAHRKRGPNGAPLNLVHRDVSPQNILISYEGEVKLVDFGIAKAATKVHVTQHGALTGKLLYMSPEQAWGRNVDKRTDLFSLGAVLYELLTGRALFFDENDTEVTILEKVREAKIPPVREFNSRIPPDLEKIVMKALRKNPDDRYQAAFEMQNDLDSLFYTEGYNVTSAGLANFVRSLFPEEWSQETGVKEAAAVHEKEAPPKAAAAAAPVPPPAPTGKPVVAPSPKPAPSAAVPPPSPEKRAEPPLPPKTEPVPEQKEAVKPSGFRDISMPEIYVASEPRKFPFATIGIIIFVIAVGVLAYFLFRPKPSAETTPPEPAQVRQPSAALTSLPPQAPAVEKGVPATVEDQKRQQEEADAKRKAEEEQKKLADQKAEEEKKKEAERLKEEERKKQEQAKLEQARLEEERRAAQKEAEAKIQYAPPPEEKKQEVAQLQPPPQQSTPETPKMEPPQQEKETTTQAPGSSVKEGDLVDLTPDVTKPEVTSRVNPTYPPAAHAKRIEGTVILSVLVSETGAVSDVKVLRGAGGSSGLNEAAMNAMRKWKFRPAVKDGKRVKVWVTYPIVFKLH